MGRFLFSLSAAGCQMNTSLQELEGTTPQPLARPGNKPAEARVGAPAGGRSPLGALVSLPVGTLVAFVVHLWASKGQPAPETYSYSVFLGIIAGLAIVAGGAQ